MKKDARHRTSVGHWLRFVLRTLGSLGLFVLCLALWVVGDVVFEWDRYKPALNGALGINLLIAFFAIVIGLGVTTVWILLELLLLILQSTGRKAAVGANLLVQILLAVGLLVAINAVSFRHYYRADTTRDQRFTIAPELKKRLAQLNPETPTKVIVLQRNKTSSIEPDNPGALEAAAQAKIVEKVRDVVDELRELGPRFQITVLATGKENFESQLAELTTELPATDKETKEAAKKRENENRERGLLKSAILSAPENSIFFASNGRIQRLGFNQFYLLDKAASVSRDNPGQRNLVLVPQGKAAFIEKVLALEERTPKVAVLTIHPLLTTRLDTGDEYTAAGLRKVLESQGFEVTDVILKRWGARGTPTPSADTFDEKDLARLERAIPAAEFAVQRYDRQIEAIRKAAERLKVAPFDEINRMFRGLPRPVSTEEDRKALIEKLAEQENRFLELAKDKREELAKSEAEYEVLLKDDRAVENARNPDVKAKMQEQLRECDVLILPRLTSMQLSGRAIPGWLHSLIKDQADVVRDFMKAGKPVLFAMGPTVADPPEPNENSNDDIEKMLARLGIDLGADAIITDAELKATPDSDDPFAVPADTLQLDTGLRFDITRQGVTANRITGAYLAAGHSVDAQLDAQKKATTESTLGKLVEKKRILFKVARNGGYRSIVVSPAVAAKLAYDPEILHTVEKSWNETKPQKEDGYVPTFDPPKPDDPKKGGREDEVMKSYSVGVALETTVPAEWNAPVLGVEKYFSDAGLMAPTASAFPPGLATATTETPDILNTKPEKTLRVIVFGHGGLFIGKSLDPGRETLLINSVEWLLNRQDRMPHDTPDNEKWRYPRVALTPEKINLWGVATRGAMPGLAVFCCIMVLMIRRLR
jgi:hypothetical protein